MAWPDPRPDKPSLQRLIWLPDPEDAALQLGLDELGSSPKRQSIGQQLSLPRASGHRDIPLAICRSLADFHGVPFNRDNLVDEIDALLQRQTQLNLINIGQLLSSLDLFCVLVELPLRQLSRVPCPAVLATKGTDQPTGGNRCRWSIEAAGSGTGPPQTDARNDPTRVRTTVTHASGAATTGQQRTTL